MGRTHLVKYYLQKWGYFDQNLNYLTRVDDINVKILYSALKDLGPEERQFLAAKYRVAKKPIIQDSVLAEQHGLSLRAYREKRFALEIRLLPIITMYKDLYQDDFSKAIDSMSGHRRHKPIKEKSVFEVFPILNHDSQHKNTIVKRRENT